jgi:hypothetical protein
VFGGQKLMQRVLELEPDIVVFAFAMNEPRMAGFTDTDLRARVAADHPLAARAAPSPLRRSRSTGSSGTGPSA